MIQKNHSNTVSLQNKITKLCKKIAGSSKISGICLFGNYILNPENDKTAIEILLIIQNFRPKLLNYFRMLDKRNLLIIAVDQQIFDKDVDHAFLGRALSGILIFPYISLVGLEYLQREEIKLKKHLIIELLKNALANFTELYQSLRFEPKYFMYKSMLNRAQFYPTVVSNLRFFTKEKENKEIIDSILQNYIIALKELEREGKVVFVDCYIKISEEMEAINNNPRIRLKNISKIIPQAILTTIIGLRPQVIDFFSSITHTDFRFKELKNTNNFFYFQKILNPKQYIYVLTSQGFISQFETDSIDFFVRKVFSALPDDKIEIEAYAGLLNDVYLIRIQSKTSEKRAIGKRFRNWSSFKWVSLNLLAIGTKSFSVSGHSRLEREVTINELLYSKGFKVPKILYISHSNRLVLMEYIYGESFEKLLKQFVITKNSKKSQLILEKIKQIGELFARIHSLDVSLGDTKPENWMLDKKNNICLIDLEQASMNGDKTWDIAEFLYYSGHYMPLFNGDKKAIEMAQEFIKGYLTAGGDIKNLRKAGTVKYTRVFNVFTSPRILSILSNMCSKVEDFI